MEEMERMSAYQKAARIAIYSKKVGELLEQQRSGKDVDGEIQKKIETIEDKVDKLLEFFLQPGDTKPEGWNEETQNSNRAENEE